jgi:hypothetical protein
MFTREDILGWTRKQPFQPFAIKISSGEVFEIAHPDMIIPTRSSLYLGKPEREARDPAVDRVIQVALVHVTQIESI